MNGLRNSVISLLLLLSTRAVGADEDFAFVADEKVASQAKADAEMFVEMAKRNFDITLDYSDASIEQVEQMADEYAVQLRQKAPPDEIVLNISYVIGGYVGETYRRNHGGSWGVMTQGGNKFSGMRGTSGHLFWPTGKVEKRIRNGPEDNLWDYYQVIIKS